MKKAYIKTVEVIIAILFSTLFLLYVIPGQSPKQPEKNLEILTQVEKLPDVRNFVAGNSGCYDSSHSNILTNGISVYLPESYDYKICINNKTNDAPDQKIFIDTVVISGNMSVYNPKTVRLYHWLR
ncbi:hypothetical protein GF327_07020 [Candidatus Woesearchaeota archaeon]|nr:hypothetical protein [Candidatus Woesearchaeota archaeon]